MAETKKWTAAEFKEKFWIDTTDEALAKAWIKDENDEWIKRHSKEMKAKREREWWIGWANNLDAEHIIALGKKMYDGDLNKVNDVLEKKWFRKLNHFPRDIQVDEDDELYLDF